MDRLAGRLKHYDWGSATALSDLRGVEPSGRPEAELWFGSGDGPGSDLPYLVKVLAVDRPLSLQVHPDDARARAGFAAEEAAGVAMDSSGRVFVADRAKPELASAVTPFEGLCGLRPVDEALDAATGLGLPDGLTAGLAADGPAAWPTLVGEALRGGWSEAVAALVDRCRPGMEGRWADTAKLVARLADLHPGDPALLVVPMLCHHRLQPGEAVFVGPGVPHLYLSGLAVEVMPPGDNVLRGGLTAKRVDVPALVEALDPTAGAPPVQRATSDVHRYDVPGDDFGVCRLTDTGIDVEDRIGPDLVLGMAGSTTVGDDLVIGPGESAVVPEADGPYRLATDGLAYLVTVGAA